jgi:hypothetical protein
MQVIDLYGYCELTMQGIAIKPYKKGKNMVKNALID